MATAHVRRTHGRGWRIGIEPDFYLKRLEQCLSLLILAPAPIVNRGSLWPPKSALAVGIRCGLVKHKETPRKRVFTLLIRNQAYFGGSLTAVERPATQFNSKHKSNLVC